MAIGDMDLKWSEDDYETKLFVFKFSLLKTFVKNK